MIRGNLLRHVVVRNALGLLALLAVHYVSDQYHLRQREGFDRVSPYLFLLLLYGWIVLHNRLLFERLYLRGQKKAYFAWLALALGLTSFNTHYILRTGFGVTRTLPHIVSFWVYTVTGLGVYVIFRYLQTARNGPAPVPPSPTAPAAVTPPEPVPAREPAFFQCIADGMPQAIAHDQILYLESLENYVKVVTGPKTYLIRLTMKEAEARLPKPPFLRISRSHLVNTAHIGSTG
ncbi:MAG: LytTR family transcriptional regulator DNA-binding domain-containing protein, partial [Cytophagales bacterium]|nr:LytTR family transcriptional regulator DNA-binding domain-containing protein [Cytophagales bacterium]